MKIFVVYRPECEPYEKNSWISSLQKYFELGEFFYQHMPHLSEVLPEGTLVKFPDATIDVPDVQNDTGDVWFRVLNHEYNTKYPDIIFHNLTLDDAFDINGEEFIKFLRFKFTPNP